MGARHYCLSRVEGRLPRASRTTAMGFNGWETLVGAVMSLLYALIRHCSSSHHFTFALHQANSSELWCNHHRTSCTIAIRITSSMSRERGRSHRRPCLAQLHRTTEEEATVREGTLHSPHSAHSGCTQQSEG
jgi:hypothetical protein